MWYNSLWGSLHRKRIDPPPHPPPPFALDVKTDDHTHTHTNQEGVEIFIAHIMKLFRESRDIPKQVLKWLKRTGKGDWLGLFVVVRGWGWGEW